MSVRRGILLGSKVKDSITGFEGVAVGRTEFLYGCIRIGIEGVAKPGEILWFDEPRLTADSEARSGGPMPSPTSRDPR